MKTKTCKRMLAFLLTVILVVGTCFSAMAAPNFNSAVFQLQAASQAVDTVPADKIVTVVVELEKAATLDVPSFAQGYQAQGAMTVASMAQEAAESTFRQNAVTAQEAIQAKIAQIFPDAKFRYHYTNLLNGFAARVRFKDIESIRNLPGVLDVYMTMTYSYDNDVEEGESLEYIPIEEYYERYGAGSVDLDQAAEAPAGVYSDFTVFSDAGSTSQMGLEFAWNAGFTGAGKVVAVFDSSLRHTHELFQYMDPDIVANNPDYRTKSEIQAVITANPSMNLFNEGWGSWFHGYDHTGFNAATQTAIRSGGFWRNEKVSFAVDYCNGDLEVWDGDSSSHGTHVSGIVTGNPGPTKLNGVKGSAYDAQLYFFKVFDIDDSFGQESDEAVFAALDDAVTLGVNAFNLSLGIPNGFSTMNTYAQAGYQRAYNRAKAAGISVALSAGNDARDTHPNALVSGYTALLPNSGKVGFSGSLFSPMTTASNQGTGYSYRNYYTATTMSFVDASGNPLPGATFADIVLPDNNTVPMGTTLTGRYPLVNCGNGSVTEITAAGNLAGKIALVKRGGNDEGGQTLSFVVKQQNAFNAGAVACVMFDNAADGNTVLSGTQLWDTVRLPTFGMFTQALGNDVVAALTGGTAAYVKFASVPQFNSVVQIYNDSGPVTSTSWGVTEALRLKPDIMAPGGSILSAGASSDTVLSVKSGTSMATPNVEGVYILIQQAMDQKIRNGIFKAAPGTLGYSSLVDQLAGSTAKVFSPLSGATDVYFSPRRQGAGQVRVDRAIASNVILRSNTPYNPVTGETARTKLELGDNLGDTFEFTFALENFNNAQRSFDVRSCLQTDATTLNATTGRYNLVGPSSSGSDIDPLRDAVITVKSVSGATLSRGSANINRYAAGISAANITVPANAYGANAAQITVQVTLGNMAARDAIFTNGMFLDGYMFLDCTNNDAEDVNIPFMGFRGDWLKAPIFDFQDAYTSIAGWQTDRADYPLFNLSSMATRDIVNGVSKESPLGANLTVSAWPGFAGTGRAPTVRSYFNTLRADGHVNRDFVAFSPNGDNLHDFAYANLALLRNAKALCIVIRDSNGQIVKTLGPDYEYFELHDSDGNQTQQIAATYGTKYLRKLQWDGKKTDGSRAPDGQYTYEVRAMLEYEYLKKDLSSDTPATVLSELMTSPTVQVFGYPVKVDTVAPKVSFSIDTATKKVTSNATDSNSGLMCIELFYGTTRLGLKQCNLLTDTAVFDYAALAQAAGVTITDTRQLSVLATDYAMNSSSAKLITSLKTGLPVVAVLYIGQTLQMSPTWTPDTVSNVELEYVSQNTNAVTVSSTGLITAVSIGSSMVYVIAKDGSGLRAQVSITVRPFV